jgi:hypothetical protein
VSYENGSYYSAAEGGYGDYYYAPEPRLRYDYYDDFFYGSSFYAFGGYCSARYLSCPDYGYGGFLDPFHRFGYLISYGDNGWYDPFWDGYARLPPYHHHHRGNASPDGPPSDSRFSPRAPLAERAPRRDPAPRDGPPPRFDRPERAEPSEGRSSDEGSRRSSARRSDRARPA